MTNAFKTEEGRQLVFNRYKEILANWPVKNKQYSVSTSIGSTFIIESGRDDKPSLILLHGSVSNSFTWFTDVIELSNKFKVFAVDVIGDAGLSEMVRPGYRSGAYEKWLHELMGALNIESAHFAGISLGGWMAINFCIHFPRMARSIFLISPGGLSRVKRSFLWKVLLYSLSGNKRKIFILLNGGKDNGLSHQFKSAMAFTGLINKHFKPRTDELPVFKSEELAQLTMPVMLVFGAKDCIFNADESALLLTGAAPQAEVIIYPDAGHIIVDQSEKMIDFFEKPSHNIQPNDVTKHDK